VVSTAPSTELSRLAADLGDLARREVPIGALTTYRVGGAARLFCQPSSEDDLARLLQAMAGSAVPVLVIGKGSNLLVADRGWDGLCVHLGDAFASVEIDGLAVVAGAATAYPVLARRTGMAGLTGMEWAVGIPGSVGGAVRMNAGGHGAETRDRLVKARIIDLAAGVDRWTPASELHLRYRHSSVASSEVVVAARFALDEGDASESAVRIAEIVRWRRLNQPGGQNAGSVFTNPEGDSAGRLIEAAGLKGLRLRSASVSEKHANFIQADASGSADDVRHLIEAVQRTVADRLGVDLEVEVQLVGWGPSHESADTSCS
jgi:UDP-N-acetylmuramate dehydrogenase